MPTFTAIALDRLLEPGSGTPSPRRPPRPPPAPIKVGRTVQDTTMKRSPRPNISPALYATPESTPLPDSPSSFSPDSPYIINHKRRGPCLVKSLWQNEAGRTGPKPPGTEEKIEVVNENARAREGQKAGDGHGSQGGSVVGELERGALQGQNLDKGVTGAEELDKPRSDDRDQETEGFFDLQQDSPSNASNSEVDDSGARWKSSTPLAEYYDALDEISSDGTARSCLQNVEDELRDMRLNVLMEIEKRKQAEEALENLRNQWKNLSHHLSLVGLKLPIPPTVSEGMDVPPNLDSAKELYLQVVVAHFVADALGRGCARAEVELEMEPQIASKDFEIARLWDRLHYYEAANREMSQRNQEAIELARQQRNRYKMRQKWFWRSICLAITLGGAAIAWSYLPSSKPTHSEGDSTSSTYEQ